MDISTVKSALLVALITATILWTVNYFAIVQYEDIIGDGSVLFDAFKTWFVMFMTVLGTELSITYIAQPKPVQSSGSPAPSTSTEAVAQRLNSNKTTSSSG